MVRPMAGDGTGFWALPAVGDQVLVAFLGGDVSKPYVLGALWTAKRPPPTTNADGLNSKRMLTTPSGHEITFDDSLGLGSLTISAAGDLSIKATGNIKLEAGMTKIEMTPTGVDIT
jgi:phage baseplate assembly protein V